MTSRTPLLDQLLAIRNLLALGDHELEQIVNLEQEQIEGLKLTAEGDPLPDDALSDSYDQDIAKTVVQYHDHYQLRKELQRSVFDSYNIDLEYRCQFKHRLTVHEALKEIADATGSSDDRWRYYLFTKDLYLRIWEITGLWHTPCGRCLLDAEEGGGHKTTSGPAPSVSSPKKKPSTSTVNSIPTGPEPEDSLNKILDRIFSNLEKNADPATLKLQDLNEHLVKFLCAYFGICTEEDFRSVLNTPHRSYPDLHRVEDRILWYLVETRTTPLQCLTLDQLKKLQELDLPTEIPYYAYILSYYLYSDGSLSLSDFAKKIFEEKPHPVFTGDFRVEDPFTPFLLYTFKPIGKLTEPEIIQAGRYFWNSPTLGKMMILKKRAPQSLTFSQAYPEDKKYKLVSDPYLRTFFSVDHHSDLLKGSDFPKHTFSDFHLPDVSANKAKEGRILLYLSSFRKEPFRTREHSYLTDDDRNLETLLKINRI